MFEKIRKNKYFALLKMYIFKLGYLYLDCTANVLKQYFLHAKKQPVLAILHFPVPKQLLEKLSKDSKRENIRMMSSVRTVAKSLNLRDPLEFFGHLVISLLLRCFFFFVRNIFHLFVHLELDVFHLFVFDSSQIDKIPWYRFL